MISPKEYSPQVPMIGGTVAERRIEQAAAGAGNPAGDEQHV